MTTSGADSHKGGLAPTSQPEVHLDQQELSQQVFPSEQANIQLRQQSSQANTSSVAIAIKTSEKMADTNNNDCDRKQRRHQRIEKCTQFVLNPSGPAYCRWSLVVSLAFLYNFWSLSYRFAFKEIDERSFVFWFALDYTADAIYILDVVINFHTGFLNNGVLERDLDKISVHYKESTLFYLDCLCLLPLDILYLSFGYNSILRITRLVKIYKFWACVDRTERHTNYPNLCRTLSLVHYILVIFHWNACILFMLAKNGKNHDVS